MGGGFGIPYQNKEKKINIRNYSKLVKNFKKKLNCKIIFEPGRFIVGNAGTLISKIILLKKMVKKNILLF